MSAEPRSVFLMVRSQDDLERAKDELTSCLSILQQKAPDSGVDSLQGIWIDAQGVANLPRELNVPEPDDAPQTVRIAEAMGINGIWMICWLEVAPDTMSRADLVAGLLESQGQEGPTDLSAQYIPVVAGEGPDPDLTQELRSLEERYPGLLLPPRFQDANGRLVM